MILVRNLRLGTDEPEDKLKKLAARELGVSEREILSLKITKKSLDARKKNDIHWLYSAAVPIPLYRNAKFISGTGALLWANYRIL